MLQLLLFITLTNAALYGVDISQLHSVDIMKCFVSEGYTFIIPRCYRDIGSMDDNCYQNVKNAHAAGMKRVDVYFLPCFSCGNVRGHVQTFWNTVSQWDVTFERTWLDIEGGWSSSYSANQVFFNELMNSVRSVGFVHGIYCNQYHWNLFFTLDFIYRYASETKLWYCHWDYEANFDQFEVVAFGGWTWPNMKQYQDTTWFCGGAVDFNYEER